MESSPIGGLYSKRGSNEHRYANVVLQSLSVLETIKDSFLRQNNPYINQTMLAGKLLNILNVIYNSPNDGCTFEIINTFYQLAKNSNDSQSSFPLPYNFLVFFLQFLDDEYNRLYKIQRIIPQNKFQDIESAANNLQNYIQSMKSSLIFQDFYFSVIFRNICNSCRQSNCEWKFEKIIELKIDNYKQMKNGQVTLSECLQYYMSGINSSCPFCRQNNYFQSRIFYKTGKVLIFNLIRNNNIYTGQTDNMFKIDMNIDISRFKKNYSLNPQYNNYTLKSRICYAGTKYGFFVDCFVKRDNMKGVWYRYSGENKRSIGLNEINEYEPVLLIYEICGNMPVNNMSNYDVAMNNNNMMSYNNNMAMNNNMMQNNNMNYYKNMNNNMNYNYNTNSNMVMTNNNGYYASTNVYNNVINTNMNYNNFYGN